MNILETLVQLRNDIKTWVTNNLVALDNKIESKTIPIDTELKTTSTNPVQNKVITEEINEITNDISNISDAVADISNDISNIVDDGSGEFNIADSNNNVVMKVDAQGIHTTDIEVNGTSIKNKISKWDNKSEFSGDYNDLINQPNIVDDGSDNLIIADSEDNKIVQVDKEGIHTTKLITDNIIIDEKNLNQRIAGYDEHVADTIVHISSKERETWNNKSDFDEQYTSLKGAPNIVEGGAEKEVIFADEEDNVIAKINEDGFATTNIAVKDEITATKVTVAEEISAKKVTINGADIEEAFVSIKDELIGNSGDSADKDTIYGAKTHTDNKVSDLKNELSESIVSQSDSWTIVDNETDGNIILTVDKNGLETTNITSQTLETTDITSDDIKAETTLTVANINVKEAIEKNQQEINNIKDGTTSAGKANQLAESIKLTLGKDMSGEISFNGAEDITLNATSNIEINGDNEFIECEKISNEAATQYKVAHKKLNSSGASTYTKVTVDEAGHVTIGTNPTTLAGYGIKDAYTQGEVNGKISEAISTAAADATNKADAALTAANSYTDTVKDELSESITSKSDSWTVADQDGNIIAAINEDGLKTTGVETNTLRVDGKNIADYLSSYAEDIYFKEDIIVTEKVGNISINPTTGTGTIPSKDKNIKQVFEAIWSTDKEPTVIQPSITLSSYDSSYEIGHTIITPQIIATFNSGSYPYGSKIDKNSTDTGVSVTEWTASTSFDSYSETASSGIEFINTFNSFTIANNSTKYKIIITAEHGDGRIPLTALGNASSKQIVGNTITKTITYTGYKPNFYGFKTTDTAISIDQLNDSNIIRNLGTNQESDTTPESSLRYNGSWIQFFYAVPSDIGYSTLKITNADTKIPYNVKVKKDVTVNHEGSATSTYNLFYIDLSAPDGPTTNLELDWS